MNIENLKVYYNRIDNCSVVINGEVDFDYVQTQIGKIGVHTEELNRIIGEILIETTRLEHLVTDSKFEFELRVTNFLNENETVKKFSTAKERVNYIQYVLLKDDFKKITDFDQELRDVKSLLELAKKKAKDLDRVYPKLKTLWESVQTEMKYIKKVGSDMDYISKVRDSISNDNVQKKPIFTDTLVEQIQTAQYNDQALKESAVIQKDKEIPNANIEAQVNDLLADL